MKDEMSRMVPQNLYQDALNSSQEGENKRTRDSEHLKERVDQLNQALAEAKSVCSMQQIVITQKDQLLNDADRRVESLKREVCQP